MQKRISFDKNWIYAVFACFSFMAVLNADLSGIAVETTGSGLWDFLSVNMKKAEYLIPEFTYRDAFLAFFIFVFFHKTKDCRSAKLSCWTYRIPAALTACFLVFGYSFRYTNSWSLIFMDLFHRLVSAAMICGFYFVTARIYQLLLVRICESAELKTMETGRISSWIFEEHAFFGPLLAILVFWSPYIIAKFPGASMPETLAEMRQYYWHSINNYYPPLHTVAMSWIMELGNLLGSYTLGFFLNLLVQLGLLLSAFAYGFLLMKRWKTPYGYRWLALGIIGIVQFFPMEATVVEKDIPYSACVIFFVLLLYELIRTMDAGEMYSRRTFAGMLLAGMGIACSRNEGFYLILAGGVGISIHAYRLFGREDRKKYVCVLAAMLAPVVLFAGYQKLLLPVCGVEDNGLKEVLSIPFQQTARYVRDYGYELTEEEEAVIACVLDAENLTELYDPITSDPVKATYHARTAGDLVNYFILWFHHVLKHPGNAVEATMNNAYGWFYQEGYAQNYMMTSRIEGHEVRWEITQPEYLGGFRQAVERWAKCLSRVPVLNWFENAGIVSWLTILLTFVWLCSDKRRYVLALLPLLTALLVCVAAPTFRYQMRYIMPVMFCVPFYIPMLVQSLQE